MQLWDCFQKEMHVMKSAKKKQGQTVNKLQIATFWNIYIYIPLARLYIYIYIERERERET